MSQSLILVDTQIALWILLDDSRLPITIKEKCLSSDYTWIFHQISVWEIQIKFNLGKLELPDKPSILLPKFIEETGFHYAQIDDEGIFMLEKLPKIHRDPFDRLLIAHAISSGWTIATTDSKITEYPVKILN